MEKKFQYIWRLQIEFENSISFSQSVELFVRSLDIGDVGIIPGISGVSRTISGLTTLIIDINLKANNLRENLIWFNSNINHFVMQFSDDGAP